MTLITPKKQLSVFRTSSWLIILLIFIGFSCEGDEDQSSKQFISGVISSKNSNGDLIPLANFSVDLLFYTSVLPPLNSEALVERVTTDANGYYEFELEDKSFKAMAIRNVDPYFALCYGTVQAMGPEYHVAPIDSDRMIYNLQLCQTINFKIVASKGVESTNTVNVSYLAKSGDISFFTPGKELSQSAELNYRFFSSITKLDFTFIIKDSNGVTLSSTTQSRVTEPGTTTVLNVDF